jgi:hypothetical protein
VWISGSQANFGGVGGGLYIGPTTTADVESSTISGNTAAAGGGIFDDGQLALINSTISGNQVTASEGGRGGGGLNVDYRGSALLVNDTIADNSALVVNDTNEENMVAVGDGGGVFVAGSLTLGNTLVADNPGGNFDAPDGLELSDLGNNLESDGSGGEAALFLPTDLVADPLLGPLQNNGGRTPTQLPGRGSPAIDAGASVLTLADQTVNLVPATDQRGLPRPSGAGVDIGAVEVQVVVAPPPVPPVPPGGKTPPAPPPQAPPVTITPPFVDPTLAGAIGGTSTPPAASPSKPSSSVLFQSTTLSSLAFPGGRLASSVTFTQSGGGDVPPDNSQGTVPLVRDERSFGPLTAFASATLRDAPEFKAIQMAESILDGDDLVGQFAQFLPRADPARQPSPAAPAQGPDKPQAVVLQGQTQAEAKDLPTPEVPSAAQGLPWRVLVVLGNALLVAAIWLVAMHRRARKVSA